MCLLTFLSIYFIYVNVTFIHLTMVPSSIVGDSDGIVSWIAGLQVEVWNVAGSIVFPSCLALCHPRHTRNIFYLKHILCQNIVINSFKSYNLEIGRKNVIHH